MQRRLWGVRACLIGLVFLPLSGVGQPLIEEQELWCPYTTIAMLAEYRGEEHEGGYYETPVRYLDRNARRHFRIFVLDGLIVDAHGYPVDGEAAAFQGEDDASTYGIFAMDGCGRIYFELSPFCG